MQGIRFRLFIAIIIIAVGAGCTAQSDYRPGDFPHSQLVNSSTSIGQTFLARHGGLNGVEIFLAPAESGDGVLELSLFEASNEAEPIATTTRPLEDIKQAGYYRFLFSPIRSSFKHTYYLRLSVSVSGSVYTSSDASTYLDGGMYLDDVPNGKQLVFGLYYEPSMQFEGILTQFLQWTAESSLATALFILPGLAILLLFCKALPILSIGEKLGLSAGLSAAILPVLYAFAFALHVSPGRWLTWAVLLSSSVFVVYRIFLAIRQKAYRKWLINNTWAPDVALFAVICIISFTRFWAIRTFQAPIGLDPIHHTAIVKLILQNNGLFQSWLPFAPYQTFSTHFGFHLLAASYIWVSGLDHLQAILISAQTFNVLSAVAVYPLALRFSNNNRWAGVGAVLAIGLFSPMPAFFINWGRYPQLVGQLILPVVCWFSLHLLETRTGRSATAMLGGLTLTGLTYAYYRLPYYFVAFIAAWVLFPGLLILRKNPRKWLDGILSLLGMGIVAILLFLPWAPILLTARLGTEETHGTINTIEQVIADYQAWKGILIYVSLPLLISAGGGLLTGIVRREWGRLILPLWIILLASLVAVALLNIPGLGLMQNNAILMAMYIPLGILAGGFLADVDKWALKKRWHELILAAVVVCVGVLGIPSVARLASPSDHTFITTPDLRAMQWIRENTPKGARIFTLVQRFKQTSAIAFDAGWWIPVLTERQNNMPPQYALVMEKPYEEGYNEKVVQWAFALENFAISDPQGIQILCENGFDFVYFGEYGRFLTPQAREIYLNNIQEIHNSPAFSVIYQEDLVKIYQFNKDYCQTHP